MVGIKIIKKIIACLLIASFLTGCNITQLSERENELLQKENNLQQREEELQQRESELLQIKIGFSQLEEDLQKREDNLLKKETDLQNLEEELQQHINEIPEGHDVVYIPQNIKPTSVSRAQYIVRNIYRKLKPESVNYLDDDTFTCNEIVVVNNRIYYLVHIFTLGEYMTMTFGWYLVDVFTEGVYDMLHDEFFENELRLEDYTG